MTHLPVQDVPVQRRIEEAYARLPATIQKFADHVLANPVNIAGMSIQAAADYAGVSVASANRFSTAIGYSGYQNFRKALIASFETAIEPAQRFEKALSRHSSGYEVFNSILTANIDNMESLLSQTSEDRLEEIVDRIIAARRIAIVGFATAASLGELLATGLNVVREGVSNLAPSEGAFGAARRLSHMTFEDLVVAIAFPRYIADTVRLARLAHSRGIPVIAITDSHRSPLTQYAVASLYVPSRHPLFSVSNAAALVAIEALVATIAHRTPRALERIEEDARALAPWLEPALNARD
jgi:DNA-binding MurR/RpiR family transcriptional regulator